MTTRALLAAFVVLTYGRAPRAAESINWETWSDTIFERARAEKKLVLLDLHAVWCHWCHVMDQKTYSDAKVIHLIRQHYIALKVDQDTRPDLVNRYEDYGWPATIIYNSDGQEIVQRSGYIEPARALAILQAVVDDPTPGPASYVESAPATTESPLLPTALRSQLRQAVDETYDVEKIGWGKNHKYLEPAALEYALLSARQGDTTNGARAIATLDAAKQLVDPVWGGIYQYSVGDWVTPHFEKIMSMQADSLRLYTMAAQQFSDRSHVYLGMARAIADYLQRFLLSPSGAFYTSQDADLQPGKHAGEYFLLNDERRRRLGVPRIDKHVYARDNGWAIAALAQLYAITDDAKILAVAQKAAANVTHTHQLTNSLGGFSHGPEDKTGPFLGDTLAMAQARLALYTTTADRSYLQQALQSADFIQRTFATSVGFCTVAPHRGEVFKPVCQRDENIAVARFANALFLATGSPNWASMRDVAMRLAAAPSNAERAPAAVLVADFEVNHAPLHICVVGSKKDATALGLYKAALRYPEPFKRLEWWDRAEGPLPNPDVDFPKLAGAAAYICTGQVCSVPVRTPGELFQKIEKLHQS